VVIGGTASVLLVAVLITEIFSARIGLFFDVVFVLSCIGAALLVRPRDFFAVGVLPPLALTATVLVLAFVDRAAVARAEDGVVQATVSGLAHHAQALAIGYALTLVILALRQFALHNHGRLRPPRDDAPQRDEVAEAHPV
jgi:hypothetical protein